MLFLGNASAIRQRSVSDPLREDVLVLTPPAAVRDDSDIRSLQSRSDQSEHLVPET